MRFTHPSIVLALACGLLGTEAFARGAPRQLGETLELRKDGPFQKATFKVIRNLEQLTEAFGGNPPRTDIDFSQGLVVLYATPGSKLPVFTDCVNFSQRLDLRVQGFDASEVADFITCDAEGGTPYHMVQLRGVSENTQMRLSRARSSTILARLNTEGPSPVFNQVYRYPAGQRVNAVVKSFHGETIEVSPHDRSYATGTVPVAWVANQEGRLGPNTRVILQVPVDRNWDLTGGLRFHPTSATLNRRLAASESLPGTVVRLEGDLYTAPPYADAAIDLYKINTQTVADRNPATRAKVTLDTVFPYKPLPNDTSEDGLVGAPVVNDSRTAIGVVSQENEVTVDDGPGGPSTAVVKVEDGMSTTVTEVTTVSDGPGSPADDVDETTVAETETETVTVVDDGPGGQSTAVVKVEDGPGDTGLVGVVTEITEEMESETEEETVTVVEDGPGGTQESETEDETVTVVEDGPGGTQESETEEETVTVVEDGPGGTQESETEEETVTVVEDGPGGTGEPVVKVEESETEEETVTVVEDGPGGTQESETEEETVTVVEDGPGGTQESETEEETVTVVEDGPGGTQESETEEETVTVVEDGPGGTGEPVVKVEEPETEEETVTVVEDGPGGTQEQEQEEETTATVSDDDQEQEQEEEQEQEQETEDFPWKGTVCVSELNVRYGPSHQARGALVFLQGTEVEITGRQGDWLVVKIPELNGFVGKSLINFPNGKGKKGGPATVNMSYINLRTQASRNSKVQLMLREGFPLTVERTGHRGSWLRVASGGEFEAFVHSRYVRKH